MEDVHHEKEEEGIFFGEFNYLTEGAFCGSYEAKCSQACINILLQQPVFVEGLAVIMDDQALTQAIDSLHVRTYFGISEVAEMESLFLVNWKAGELDVFGSLMALYEVLKSKSLNLLPLSALLHPVIAAANSEPENARAYLYFLDSHWMVLRQLGRQWYKFDPWLGGPQLLTHFYVSLYIKQLVADSKLVFVIDGDFPRCPADTLEEQLLEPEQEESADQPGKLSLDMSEQEIRESVRFLDLVFENEDNELAFALLVSLEDAIKTKQENEMVQKLLGVGNSRTSTSVDSAIDFSIGPEPLTPHTPFSSSGLGHRSVPTTPLTSSVNNVVVCGSSLQKAIPNNSVRSAVEGACVAAKRRIGTTVSPLASMSPTPDLNSSFDSDDLCHPFSIMFNEHGEGARCLDIPLPQPSTSSTPVQVSDQATTEHLVNSLSSSSVTPPRQPVQSPYVPILPQRAATPRVFITTADTSSFKKVLPTDGDRRKQEEEEVTCCVCWAEPPSHVVVPCGHFCLCSLCSANILQPSMSKPLCPLCKQETSSIIKIFK